MTMWGIDISHWNGKINFSAANVNFVIMKLSQAQWKDSMFEEYYNACSLPKGCYIYNKVKTVAEATAEAMFAVNALKGRPMPLGVWLDLEDSSMRKLGKSNLNAIITTEATILQNAGYKVGIYSNKDWYNNVLDSAYLSNIYPFWIARYPLLDNGTVKESLSPKNFKGCVMWQYSSKGKVNGINGNVDLDLILNDFDIPKTETKSVDELAHEVIDGLWGNGQDRKNRLHSAGYDYATIQKRVNEILKGV